jgi:hypothetical protein
VVAQSVIPGILYQEQQDQIIYGSLDEGKTIKSEPECHALMTKIADLFHLETDNQFTDESG